MLIKLIATSLVGVICFITIKQYKPEFAVLVSVATGLIMSLLILNEVELVINKFITLSSNVNVGNQITTPIIKILGVGYITEFTSDLALDSSNQMLASKIILGGKISILIIALPIIETVIKTILKLAI